MLLACIEDMFLLATWWILFGTTIAQNQLCNTVVPNGIVTSNCSRQHGSVCNFTCDPGYKPAQNVKNVTCGNDGKWIFTSTPCIEKDWGLIITTSNYSITKHVYTLPITPDGMPNREYNRSYSFPKKAQLTSVAGDFTLQRAYMFDSNTRSIYMDTNFSIELPGDIALTIFHRGLSEGYVNLAVDRINHNIYWTDPSYKWIVVKSLLGNDTFMYRVLIYDNLEGPRALAMDPMEGLLFWSDIGMLTKIEVSSLSGTNRKTLISSKLKSPSSLAADQTARRLYLYDSGRQSLETFTYEGKDRKNVLIKESGKIFSIDVYQDYVYMTNKFEKGLYYVNKTNGNPIYISLERQEEYLGLTVFRPDAQPTSSAAHCLNHGCEHICVSEKDGATCLCKDGYTLNQDTKTCSLKNEYFHRGLVFSNDSNICIADIRLVTDVAFNPNCVLDIDGIKHMIMDTDQRQMILATDMTIYRTLVDNLELHHLTEVCGIISGLAWDGYDRSIYWTEENTGIIWRLPIKAVVEDVFLIGLEKPRDIIVLSHERLVYWISDRNGRSIESSNMDGSNHHIVVDHTSLVDPKSLTYDPYTKRIYFLDTFSTDLRSVTYFDLDGSNLAKFLLTDKSLEELEIYKDHMLVTATDANGTLIMSYSITTGIQTTPALFPSTGNISAIKIFDENIRQNESGPCFNLNGECEDICLSNGKSRICDCHYGFMLTNNGKNCTSDPIKDNFMLVIDSNDNTVYQISLMDESVQGIRVEAGKTLSGVVYSPDDNVLIVGATYELSIIHLNGTMKTVYAFSSPDYDTHSPNHFAVDYSSGNVYYTAVNSYNIFLKEKSYISVISPNGKQRTLLTGLTDPSGLVVYASKGLMFYTEASDSPHIGQVNMDGKNQSKLLNLNDEKPTDLTIDYKSDNLYYIDSQTQSIKYCKVDGTNPGTLVQYYTTKLSDIFFYQDYMFLSTHANSHIIKLNVSNPNEITTFADHGELGKIKFISIYSSTDQNKNAFCSVGNGGCSTFCFPNPDGGICGCEDGIELSEGSDKVCSNVQPAGGI